MAARVAVGRPAVMNRSLERGFQQQAENEVLLEMHPLLFGSLLRDARYLEVQGEAERGQLAIQTPQGAVDQVALAVRNQQITVLVVGVTLEQDPAGRDEVGSVPVLADVGDDTAVGVLAGLDLIQGDGSAEEVDRPQLFFQFILDGLEASPAGHIDQLDGQFRARRGDGQCSSFQSISG